MVLRNQSGFYVCSAKHNDTKGKYQATYSNTAFNIKVLVIVNAQLLGRKLLQPIGILRLSRPGIGLLQASPFDFGFELLSFRIDASRRRVEKALDLGNPAGFHHVEGNHRVIVHDDGMVALDESHATHVGSKVEHMVTALHDLGTILEQTQIDEHEFVAEDILRHVLIALPVAGDDVMALALQTLGKVTETGASERYVRGRFVI